MMIGWPFLVSALLLAAAGIWIRKPAFLWVAVVLSLPVALYISATPRFPFVGFLPLAALVAAALTVRRRSRLAGIAGVAIYAAFLAALAQLVLNEP